MNPTPPAPPNEECERCGRPFRCGVADAGPCACSGLALTPALRADLRQRYRHCLCVECLRQLSAPEIRDTQDARGASGNENTAGAVPATGTRSRKP